MLKFFFFVDPETCIRGVAADKITALRVFRKKCIDRGVNADGIENLIAANEAEALKLYFDSKIPSVDVDDTPTVADVEETENNEEDEKENEEEKNSI